MAIMQTHQAPDTITLMITPTRVRRSRNANNVKKLFLNHFVVESVDKVQLTEVIEVKSGPRKIWLILRTS